MAEELTVLDYLREQSARLNRRLDDMTRWQTGTSDRLVAMERRLAGVRRDAAADAEDVVDLKANVARLAERVQRLERRLDIVP